MFGFNPQKQLQSEHYNAFTAEGPVSCGRQRCRRWTQENIYRWKCCLFNRIINGQLERRAFEVILTKYTPIKLLSEWMYVLLCSICMQHPIIVQRCSLMVTKTFFKYRYGMFWTFKKVHRAFKLILIAFACYIPPQSINCKPHLQLQFGG